VVKEFPIPNTREKLKDFLGLAGCYRRCIPNYSKLAKPFNLLKKSTPFIWNEDTNEAFNTLQQLLTSQPLLQYPELTKLFILTTDASSDALGAILS
jgi:hypothetical protein